MKKQIILYIIILCIKHTALNAQDIVTYDGSFQGSGTIKACEGFVLKPGFKFGASNGRSLLLSIDRNTCLPYNQEITAINPSQNYIITVVPTAATDKVDITDGVIEVKRGVTYQMGIQYFDALGRPIQAIQKGITPKGHDLVSIMEYDAFGRESKQWLPVPLADNNGAFVEPDFFINKVNSYEHYAEGNPYAETIYESSPLNRVLKQFNVGQDWYDNNRCVDHTYRTNTVGNVTLFSVTHNGDLRREGNYPSGELFMTITYDEDRKSGYEYTDKAGRVIMTEQSGSSKTYYVYNNFGDLCYVLPPLAVDALKSNTTYSYDNDIVKKYAYTYKYDDQGNNIEKRLPGSAPIHMIYDKTGKLILVQDGNLRANAEWQYYKYDYFGKLLYTGICSVSTTLASTRDYFKTKIVTEIPVDNGFGYSQTSYSGANYKKLLTVNYYDNYKFIDLIGSPTKENLKYTDMDGYDKKYDNSKGLLTGMRIYMLDNPTDYTTQTYYYDNKGQLVQSRGTNQYKGYEIVYNKFDFMGNILKTRKEHSVNQSHTNSVLEMYDYTYDHANRLIDTYYTYNSRKIRLSKNEYDELGRLKNKIQHDNLNNIQYEYNIRNWLTKIKGPSFEQKLCYNIGPADMTPCYNGNISYSSWKYENNTNYYYYYYDHLNRLSRGTVITESNPSMPRWHYEEEFQYDKHGNITTLFRTGGNMKKLDNLNLKYDGNQLISVYDAETPNPVYNTKEYLDYNSVRQSGISPRDFYYDINGNMTADLDRDIVSIRYNVLNLPDTVQFRNGNQIINRYDATGNKLQIDYITYLDNVVVQLGNTINTSGGLFDRTSTVYVGNREYSINENGTTSLLRIHNSEGYIDDTGKYHYYRKDHLGNNREVWLVDNSNATTIQRTQYYPSGLPWAEGEGASKQPYKYNGQEYIEMHGYDMYDYGARGYYPAIMRFTTVDPMAEKYYSISPYAYCGNNPVRYIDPTGMEFTEEAWVWVDKLLDKIEENEKYYQNRISKKQNMLQLDGLSAKKATRLSRQITKLKQSKTKVNAVRKEIEILGDSDQLYDVIIVDKNTNQEMGALDFNFSKGNVEIQMPTNGSLGLFAHELKHAYQFETGELSIGGQQGIPFYDKQDEIEAYERGYLFGQRKYGIYDLPSRYTKLPVGPINAANHPNIMHVLIYPKQLQRIADTTNAAFRIIGVTYYNKNK